VYGYLDKPMKSLYICAHACLIYLMLMIFYRWSPGKHAMNTVHVDDVAGALWACAEWMASKGRVEAEKLAGESIPFHNDAAKVSEVEGMPAPTAAVTAPLFNLVRLLASYTLYHTSRYLILFFTKTDDNETTLFKAGDTMCRLFGAKFDFYNFVTSAMFRVCLGPRSPRPSPY
jgi:hypothetical protein